MTGVARTVEVERPLDAVRTALADGSALPALLEGVEAAVPDGTGGLRLTGADGTTWTAAAEPGVAAGEQAADVAVAWRDLDSSGGTWRVTLIALSATRTRVDLAVEREQGLLERAGGAVTGGLGRRVEADLERLKAHLEAC